MPLLGHCHEVGLLFGNKHVLVLATWNNAFALLQRCIGSRDEQRIKICQVEQEIKEINMCIKVYRVYHYIDGKAYYSGLVQNVLESCL